MDEVATFISSKVIEFVYRKLGDSVKHATVYVSISEEKVEIDVDVDASVLVDDDYLKRVVEEAADLGICLADAARESGWDLSSEKLERCWKN